MRKPLALLNVAALGAIVALAACATPGNAPHTPTELPPFREASVAVFDDRHVAVFQGGARLCP